MDALHEHSQFTNAHTTAGSALQNLPHGLRFYPKSQTMSVGGNPVFSARENPLSGHGARGGKRKKPADEQFIRTKPAELNWLMDGAVPGRDELMAQGARYLPVWRTQSRAGATLGHCSTPVSA